MKPEYYTWTKASLIKEILTLREGLHQLAREALVSEIENNVLKTRIHGIDRVREFIHGKAA